MHHSYRSLRMPNSCECWRTLERHYKSLSVLKQEKAAAKQLFTTVTTLSSPTVVNQPSNGCEKNPSEDTVSGGAWRGNKEALFIVPCDELIIRSRLSTHSLLTTLSLNVNRTGLPLEKGTWEPSFDGNDSNAPIVFLFIAHASLSGLEKKEKTDKPFASSLLGVTVFGRLFFLFTLIRGRKQRHCQLDVPELAVTFKPKLSG